MRFKSLLSAFLGCFVYCAGAATAQAACDITANVPTTFILSTSVTWTSTCPQGSGTGIQSAIDTLGLNSGGNLKFTGNGSVLVTTVISVTSKSNITIYGDTTRTPYGMDLIGENDFGYNYRGFGNPIFRITASTNITIWNFAFLGNTAGRHLGAAIDVQWSTGIAITYNRIDSVRSRGITVSNSSGTIITWLSLYAVRSNVPGEEYGGAGIWLECSTNSVIENNVMQADEYYNAGYPDPVTNKVWDTIASYAGYNNKFQHNTLYNSNSAGIYLAKSTQCAARTQETSALIWDNQVHHFQQHGLDMDGATYARVASNNVHEVGEAPLGMGNVTNSEIDYNTFYLGGLQGALSDNYKRGALHLLWGSSNNYIHDNVIKGNIGGVATVFYGIYLAGADQGYPNCTGNNFVNNAIYKGSDGWTGGVTANNTFTGNINYN